MSDNAARAPHDPDVTSGRASLGSPPPAPRSRRRRGVAALGLAVLATLTFAFPALPAVAASDGPTGTTGIWRPRPGTSWQWQLGLAPVDLSVRADVYDVEGFVVPQETVTQLHATGRKAVCYLSVGSYEDFRPDISRFPTSVLGLTMDGWPDERWLDIRQRDVLGPIMAARFDMCRAKGFDAIEADNVDGYANDTGFPITRDDQIAYDSMLADLAHARGMSIALKNSPELAGDLVDTFDFAIVEECYEYDECDAYTPFVTRGKAVLHVEYNLPTDEFCPTTSALGFSSMRKEIDLGAWRQVCPG